MTNSIQQQEVDATDLDIKEAINSMFFYKVQGRMKDPELLEWRDQMLWRFLDIVRDRQEEFGPQNAYDGATALFDTFGYRYPTDYWGDTLVSDTVDFLARWTLFSQKFVPFLRRENFNSACSSDWANAVLDNYTEGRHDT